MPQTLTIDARYSGPPEAGNGGYVCGLVAGALHRNVKVRLQRPAPLGVGLALVQSGEEEWELRRDSEVIAVATLAHINAAPPRPPSYLQALAAAQHYPGFKQHLFPKCFVCGPERAQGDGLRVFPGPVPGSNLVAAPWLPDVSLADGAGKVKPEFMWAALDCPGYYASVPDNRAALLGELAVRVDRRIPADEPCVIVAWRMAVDGRKHRVGVALYAEEGDLCALGQATWIETRA